jgi:hypothetical protein
MVEQSVIARIVVERIVINLIGLAGFRFLDGKREGLAIDDC